jgi:hypothetical protein
VAEGEYTYSGLGALSGAATTTSGNQEIRGASRLAVHLKVTAVSGTTPTIDVWLQHSVDGGVTWDDFAHFAQLTAAGDRIIQHSCDVVSGTPEHVAQDAALAAATVRHGPLGALTRAKVTLGGTTPAATVQVKVTASIPVVY